MARERWVVESIAEGTASVEVDGERVVRVPASLLPDEVRAGDALVVTRDGTGGRVTLTVERDERATREAMEASARQLADAPKDAGGGDIAL